MRTLGRVSRIRRTGTGLARRSAPALGICLLVPLLSACQSTYHVAQQVQGELNATYVAPKQFVWVDQTLSGTETVSGLWNDPYRYSVLFSQDGTPVWEEVVRDDAVADRILDVSPAVSYAASHGGVGNGPLAAHLAGANAGTVDALLTRHWVEDPTGAPAVPTVGGEQGAEPNDPFYAPMIFLQDVINLINNSVQSEVRQWRRNDVTPVYKPTDDPFPPPAAGDLRYDVYEPSLPVLTSNSPSATPPAPRAADFTKIAIYVRGGKVVEVRMVVDPLDVLGTLVTNYHLRLPKGLSTRGKELWAQAAIDRLTRATSLVPFRVQQITYIASNIGQAISISLPPKPVVASLSGIIPGQGGGQPVG
ncbi:MAG: hypothetical protein ACYCZV_16520 [Acidimicrobiales bacterium]